MRPTIWLIATLSLLAASPATAQSQDAATSPCPAGYWQMESLCLDNSTGDVLPAAAGAQSDDGSRSR